MLPPSCVHLRAEASPTPTPPLRQPPPSLPGGPLAHSPSRTYAAFQAGERFWRAEQAGGRGRRGKAAGRCPYRRTEKPSQSQLEVPGVKPSRPGPRGTKGRLGRGRCESRRLGALWPARARAVAVGPGGVGGGCVLRPPGGGAAPQRSLLRPCPPPRSGGCAP